MPAPKDGAVQRPAALERLEQGRASRLTLVCAPAGWGKTSVLAEWHAADAEQRAFAWVSLDPSDDDPSRFWRYVVAALDRAKPGLGAGLGGFAPGAVDLSDLVIAPLINALDELDEPIVLVLDDYHVIRSEAVHGSIAFLLRRLPETLQLVIATRADPPLPLARLRAAGELTELRAADLRFGRDEATVLLNEALGLGFADADVALLVARTEGWPAGLQLAGLSAGAAEDRHRFAARFAGDDRQIGEYLHEVLAEQPPELRSFLLRTSILQRLCAPLCDAVTGGDDGARQLDAAHRANLFVVALDTSWTWHRYHQLFGALLREELARGEPTLIRELHRRAADWYRDHGEIDEAIAHATAAGDVAAAGELIAAHWRRVWSAGETETVARWVDALPLSAVEADARLCIARGWAALYLNVPEVPRWLAAIDRAPLPGPLQDGTSTVEQAAAILAAIHGTFIGDVGKALASARVALEYSTDPTLPANGFAQLHLGMAAYHAGELETAERASRAAIVGLRSNDVPSATITGLGNLAAVRMSAGDLAGAEEAVAEAGRMIDARGFQDAPFSSRVWLARGMLAERRGEDAAAEAAFVRAAELSRRVQSRLTQSESLLREALLVRRRGARVEALQLVRRARELIAGCPDPGAVAVLLGNVERTLGLAPTEAGPDVDAPLSERELAVLRLLATDLSQREIGAQLFISLNTVKAHTRSIFRKLGVSSRAEAIARARDLTLV
jgi:LuxR family maltose regulon positive regulatory protein